jgi:hypothetical protein
VKRRRPGPPVYLQDQYLELTLRAQAAFVTVGLGLRATPARLEAALEWGDEALRKWATGRAWVRRGTRMVGRRTVCMLRLASGSPAPGLGGWRRKREPGENPGLPRSGKQERPPSTALGAPRLGSDGQ